MTRSSYARSLAYPASNIREHHLDPLSPPTEDWLIKQLSPEDTTVVFFGSYVQVIKQSSDCPP